MGIIEASNGRMDGRQAQMIPTLVSMADSIAAGGLSKVGSVLLETETNVCRRMIDTKHTLLCGVSVWQHS